ncbi:SMI1/KNR4 family protein [Metabacillus sp. JX24]|uniref:SMI1/KNR4 family protein n=1 Tax=Metabacillus sp. JX24 TaxID=3240759 RepID=UPI0035102D23
MAGYDFMKKSDHTFYELQKNDVLKAEERLGIRIPEELKDFYREVGYGFIKKSHRNAINRVMDPDTIADITLREGIYEHDPDLDGIYEDEDRLVFLEVNEGVYLTLGLDSQEQTPVYYFETLIASSLKEFFMKMDRDPDYYIEMDEL